MHACLDAKYYIVPISSLVDCRACCIASSQGLDVQRLQLNKNMFGCCDWMSQNLEGVSICKKRTIGSISHQHGMAELQLHRNRVSVNDIDGENGEHR